VKKRIAVGVVGTISVLALAYIPASPLESGISDSQANWNRETKITEDSPGWDCKTMGNKVCGPKSPKVVNIDEAEDDAWNTMQNLESYCRARGMAAEAWAEVNSLQPKGYEVIAECAGISAPGVTK
jgi:hypothetical protein